MNLPHYPSKSADSVENFGRSRLVRVRWTADLYSPEGGAPFPMLLYIPSSMQAEAITVDRMREPIKYDPVGYV